MASFTYDEGSYGLQHRDVDYLADTIIVILVKSTYAAAKADTHTAIAGAEISGVSGYTAGYAGSGRKTLASKTMTNDTTNHRTVYDAADPSTWTLGTGDTVGGAIVAKKGSADDTTATLLFFLDITDTPTNGSPFTLSFDALGIGYTQQ